MKSVGGDMLQLGHRSSVRCWRRPKHLRRSSSQPSKVSVRPLTPIFASNRRPSSSALALSGERANSSSRGSASASASTSRDVLMTFRRVAACATIARRVERTGLRSSSSVCGTSSKSCVMTATTSSVCRPRAPSTRCTSVRGKRTCARWTTSEEAWRRYQAATSAASRSVPGMPAAAALASPRPNRRSKNEETMRQW